MTSNVGFRMVDWAAMHLAILLSDRLAEQRDGEVAAKVRQGRNFLNFGALRRVVFR